MRHARPILSPARMASLEAATRSLAKIPHDFYSGTTATSWRSGGRYEADLRENPSGRKGEISRQTYQRASQIARDVVEARTQKILTFAFQTSIGGARELPNALPEEREVYERVLAMLFEHRRKDAPYLETPTAALTPPVALPAPSTPSAIPAVVASRPSSRRPAPRRRCSSESSRTDAPSRWGRIRSTSERRMSFRCPPRPRSCSSSSPSRNRSRSTAVPSQRYSREGAGRPLERAPARARGISRTRTTDFLPLKRSFDFVLARLGPRQRLFEQIGDIPRLRAPAPGSGTATTSRPASRQPAIGPIDEGRQVGLPGCPNGSSPERCRRIAASVPRG